MFRIHVRNTETQETRWFSFPMEISELEKVVADWEKNSEIIDWENDFNYEIIVPDFYGLNDIAETIEDLNEYDRLAVDALISEGGYAIEDALEKVFFHEVYIYEDVETYADVAWQIININDYGDLNDFGKQFFDYEAYGRHLKKYCTFYFKGGYAFEVC